MIKTVIFDLDGLLINSEPLWYKAEKAAFADVGIDLTPQLSQYNTGLRIDEVVSMWHNLFSMSWRGAPPEVVTNNILDNLLHLIATEATLMDGAIEVLDFFEQTDVNLAIASSSPTKIIAAALAKFGLSSYFHTTVSAQYLPYGKPHPAVFLETATFFSTPPIQCLVFEDSFNGLIAAKSAQMRTVVVPDTKQYQQTRFDIADLKLPSLLLFTKQHWQVLQHSPINISRF